MPRIQINLTGPGPRVASTWTVTTQWAVSALPTPAAMATALAGARTALAASAPFKASIASNYNLVTLHALGYLTPGGLAQWTVDASGAAVPGTGTPAPPPLAVAVSEQTAAAGPSYRGRSYWPAAASYDNTGTLSGAGQTVIRTGWLAMHSTLLTALATLGGTPVHVVYSRKTGDMTPIILIRTGDRVDTARGRFGDGPEAYTTQAVPLSLAVAADPDDSGDEVSPTAIGLPADATDAEIDARVQEILSQVTLEGITLGPLKSLWAGAKTFIALRARE